VAIFTNKVNPDRPETVKKVDEFLRTFAGLAQKRGMVIGNPPQPPRWINMEEAIKQGKIVEKLAEVANEKGAPIPARQAPRQFCSTHLSLRRHRLLRVRVLDDNKSGNVRSGVYPAIKRFSATTGHITQCVQYGKIEKLAKSAQYSAGVLLNTNLKLGGQNGHLAHTSRRARC